MTVLRSSPDPGIGKFFWLNIILSTDDTTPITMIVPNLSGEKRHLSPPFETSTGISGEILPFTTPLKKRGRESECVSRDVSKKKARPFGQAWSGKRDSGPRAVGNLSRMSSTPPRPSLREGDLGSRVRVCFAGCEQKKSPSVWTGLERKTRLGLATPTLARLCSTN